MLCGGGKATYTNTLFTQLSCVQIIPLYQSISNRKLLSVICKTSSRVIYLLTCG